jgi:hypothetical protein
VTPGIVTTKGFDVVLVVHVLAALASLTALLVLRGAARAVLHGGELPSSAANSFTGRPELAGRSIYLVAASGGLLLALSRGALSISTGSVAAGIALWLIATSVLEAVAFPAQRAVARAIHGGLDPVPAARRLLQATEFAALAVVLAAVAMFAGTL